MLHEALLRNGVRDGNAHRSSTVVRHSCMRTDTHVTSTVLFKKINRMILQSPLASAIGTQVGPTSCVITCLCCWDVFANWRKIRDVDCPTFIMHGTEDEVVPWSNGRFLHSKLRHPFPPLWCEGCGHNDMEYKRGQEMNRAIRAFLESVRGGGDRGGGEGKSPRDRRAARRASKPD